MDKGLARALGSAARAARQRLGLTQADVAERVDIGLEAYGRIERGVKLPSVETLRRLCVGLQTSADALLRLGAGSSTLTEPPFRVPESAELRRLMRRLRGLGPKQLRLLRLIARELGQG